MQSQFRWVRRQAKDARLICIPFQTLELHPRGCVEIASFLLSDHHVQSFTYVETVVTELDGFIVGSHLVLIKSYVRSESSNARRSEGRALTRTRARIAITVLKTSFAGNASATCLSRITILSSRSDTCVSCVCVAILGGLMRGVATKGVFHAAGIHRALIS